MFNNITLIPAVIYDKLFCGCADDLGNPEKIKSLSYKDQAMHLLSHQLFSDAFRLQLNGPIKYNEFKTQFQDYNNVKAKELAKTSYLDIHRRENHLGNSKPTFMLVPVYDMIGVVFTGDIVNIHNKRPFMLTVYMQIIDIYGLEVFKKLNNGELMKDMARLA